MSPSPSVPESLGGLIERAIAADGQPPFSDQSLVELGRGERALVEVERGAAVIGANEFELVVDPDARGAGIGTALVERVLAGHPGVKFAWAHGDHPGSRALAARFGFEAVRTLLQLRAEVAPFAGRVPAKRVYRDHAEAEPGLDTPPSAALDQQGTPPSAALDQRSSVSAFRPGTDDAPWLALNARAFADHPEQGRLTQRDLDDRKSEPWFDADDFLLLWSGEDLVGFCWLKVGFDTPAATQPPVIGEFYAVGIDPDRQGEGLGRVLMDAGLARLAARGIRTAALYVEADNAPALALYERYGFTRHTIDVRYRRHEEH